VMTLVGALALRLLLLSGLSRAQTLLIVYCAMAMFSFGHYATRAPWLWTAAQNGFILAETLPATALLFLIIFDGKGN